jgi:hypothetical protein
MTYPTKDENLIKGATVLMERMRPDVEMDTKLFDDVINAASKQRDVRKANSLDEQIPPAPEGAVIKEIET